MSIQFTIRQTIGDKVVTHECCAADALEAVREFTKLVGGSILPMPASTYLPVGSEVVATIYSISAKFGTEGKVVDVDDDDDHYPYLVQFGGRGYSVWVAADEIEPKSVEDPPEA